jgi:hypothetical protein
MKGGVLSGRRKDGIRIFGSSQEIRAVRAGGSCPKKKGVIVRKGAILGFRSMRYSSLFLLVLVATILAEDQGAPSSGLFVAVGYGGRRISSRDGLTWQNDQRWSDTAADDQNVLFDIAFGHDRFIAVGGGAKTGRVLSTRDGKEWTEVLSTNGRVATIAFGNGRFVAGHDAALLFSIDGTTFHQGEKLAIKGSVHARHSAFGDTEAGKMFVIIGDVDLWPSRERVSWRGSTIDGEKWGNVATDTPASHDIAYGAGQFVVVGPQGLIETSHDGVTWQRRTVTAHEDFTRIIWTGKRFLISSRTAFWTSTDGAAWVAEPSNEWDVVWAREGGMSLGFAWGGNVWRSPDLEHWQKVPLPAGPSLLAVAFGRPTTAR